jgi:hypothetical protein
MLSIDTRAEIRARAQQNPNSLLEFGRQSKEGMRRKAAGAFLQRIELRFMNKKMRR